MFDSYETDIIRIVEATYDNDGVITTSISADVGARIEDINPIIRDISGKEIKAKMLVMFDYETTAEKLYKIIIREKHGVAYEDPNYQWEIKAIESCGMFKKTHFEVYL